MIAGGALTAGLLAFSVWTFGPLIALGATAPKSPATVTFTPEPTVTFTATPTPTAAPVAPEVKAPAVEPAPVVEAPAAPTYGATGYPVPFIPSSDPQNARGGDYDVTICLSGSASTSPDGTPLCD